MYAVVKTGGKQYRVEQGQSLLVERLPADAGSKIALEPLLYSGDELAFEGADLAKVKVEAKVLEHLRGPKLRVFKFKPKRGYKRTTGHRQELTRIEITDIKKTARATTGESKTATTTTEKPAVKKPATKKPAAKAVAKAPAKKPAAKKPAAKKETTDGA